MPEMNRRGFFGLLGKVVAAGLFTKGLAHGGVVDVRKSAPETEPEGETFWIIEEDGSTTPAKYLKAPPKIQEPVPPNSFILSRPGGIEVPLLLRSFSYSEECDRWDAFPEVPYNRQTTFHCEFYVDNLSSEQIEELGDWAGARLRLWSSLEGITYQGDVLSRYGGFSMGAAGQGTIGSLALLVLDEFKIGADLRTHY